MAQLREEAKDDKLPEMRDRAILAKEGEQHKVLDLNPVANADIPNRAELSDLNTSRINTDRTSQAVNVDLSAVQHSTSMFNEGGSKSLTTKRAEDGKQEDQVLQPDVKLNIKNLKKD